MLRLSFENRIHLWIAILVLVGALAEFSWDYLVPLLVSAQGAWGNLLSSITFDEIFRRLGKALTIVGGVMTAARFWIYAERHLPQRIQDRIEQSQFASSDTRQVLLQKANARWSQAPLSSVDRAEWSKERLRELSSDTNKSEAATNLAAVRIAELKAGLSQQSFDKASLHYTRALEFCRIADAGMGADVRRQGLEEFRKAIRLNDDIRTEDQDLNIYRSYFDCLVLLGERDEAIEATNRWLQLAERKEAKRDAANALIERGRLVLQAADDALAAGEKTSLLTRSRRDFEEAIEMLALINASRDTLKAHAHELRGEVTQLQGLTSIPRQCFRAALETYVECSDAAGIKRVSNKLEMLGETGEAEVAALHCDHQVVEAMLLLGERLSDAAKVLDAQAVLFKAKRGCDALLIPEMISFESKEILSARILVAQQRAAKSHAL